MGFGYGVQWLDPSTRHRLIAHWLGVTDKEMSWQPVEGFSIVWTDKAEYQRQLGEITEVQREKLRTPVEPCASEGFSRRERRQRWPRGLSSPSSARSKRAPSSNPLGRSLPCEGEREEVNWQFSQSWMLIVYVTT